MWQAEGKIVTWEPVRELSPAEREAMLRIRERKERERREARRRRARRPSGLRRY